jgi:hypothetical protein
MASKRKKVEPVEPVERCQVTVYGRSVWEKPTSCGNKAKGKLKDGTPACGVHLRSERIRNKNMETWEKHWAERDAFKQKVDEFAQANGIEETISIQEVGKVSISWELFQKLVRNDETVIGDIVAVMRYKNYPKIWVGMTDISVREFSFDSMDQRDLVYDKMRFILNTTTLDDSTFIVNGKGIRADNLNPKNEQSKGVKLYLPSGRFGLIIWRKSIDDAKEFCSFVNSLR